MTEDVLLRALDPGRDRAQLERLWEAALGPVWLLLPGALDIVEHGVVAELGGSTSHLAALARERGIPAVLGVPGATERIPHGAEVAVDGITGIVRWRGRRAGVV